MGFVELARLLISKGAVLDVKDAYGKTPYIHAKDSLHEQIAAMLPPTVYDWFAESAAQVRIVEVAGIGDGKDKKKKKGSKKGKKGGKKKKKK